MPNSGLVWQFVRGMDVHWRLSPFISSVVPVRLILADYGAASASCFCPAV